MKERVFKMSRDNRYFMSDISSGLTGKITIEGYNDIYEIWGQFTVTTTISLYGELKSEGTETCITKGAESYGCGTMGLLGGWLRTSLRQLWSFKNSL